MKSRLRATWELLKPHALPRVPQLALVALLGLVVAFAQVSVLVLLAPLTELVLFPGSEGAFTSATGMMKSYPTWLRDLFVSARDHWGGSDPMQGRLAVLWAVVGVMLVLGLIGGLAEYFFGWFSRLVAYRMVVDLRQRLAAHLIGLSMRYHGERKLGDLLSRISADVNATLEAANVMLKDLIQMPATALFYLGTAAVVAPGLTLIVLLALPVLAIPLSMLATKVRKRSHKSLDSLGASVQALTQMFQGVRTVKAFRAEQRELARYRELNEGYLRTSMRMVRALAMTHAWTAAVGIIGMALLVLLIGWLTLRFKLFDSPAMLGTFVLAIAQASNEIKSFTKALTRVQESVGASERLLALLAEKPDVVESPDPKRLGALGSGVKLEDVRFRYPGAARDALEGVSLEIRPGETLALVGPSGSGKSTLVDLVCRFIDPVAGAIRVDGIDLRELSLDDWSKLYARVDQVPFLFHATIEQNIRYGKPDATPEEVRAAARAAGLHDFIESLPNGYASDVADMGSKLSGGQRQRITIARAFLKAAPLLVLDEATSSLDSESERVVQDALERLMAQRTVIVIAHRLSTVRRAQRIAVLDEGRLVALGTHDELLRQGGVYARLHALQNFDGSPASSGREPAAAAEAS